MNNIQIKPFSANDAYYGKKTRTKELNQFREDCFKILPRNLKIPEGKLEAFYIFGVSSKLFDCDNGVKHFQDILQEGYEFNDRMIYEFHAKKIDVEKGKEYIKFKIMPMK